MYLLYSDGEGNIFEDTSLYVTGRSGWDAVPIDEDDWIELPSGGNLYELPGRKGIGIDVVTGEMRLCEKGWAVAAFIPPAHTGLYMAAYETAPDAPTLPLFCYTAAGWLDEKIYVPAVRIEQDIRQESVGYKEEQIQAGTDHLLATYPHNRLVKHLMENCCMTYTCPAARNLAIGRWECPVPVSPACNANCIGCISFQPQDETIVSTQDRLTFKPTPEEIVEFTVPHLETAPFPLVSFGQGCEGEPLTRAREIAEAIRRMRRVTGRGSININTNGSLPDNLEHLIDAERLVEDEVQPLLPRLDDGVRRVLHIRPQGGPDRPVDRQPRRDEAAGTGRGGPGPQGDADRDPPGGRKRGGGRRGVPDC